MTLPKLRWSIILIIMLGAVLRLGEYFSNHSLNADEAKTALRLESISLKEAFFLKEAPFERMQSYPIGFLAMTKASKAIFESNRGFLALFPELALRLFPLTAGLLSLVIFYPVARFFLDEIFALWALFLFAISRDIIYLSVQLKPFASDIFFALVMTYVFWKIYNRNGSWKETAAFIMIAVGSLFFSFSAWFVIFPVAIILCAVFLIQHRPDNLVKVMVLLMFCGIAAGVYYYFSHQYILQDPQLRGFWHSAFMPLGDGWMRTFQWFVVVFKRIFGKFLQMPPSLAGFFFVVGLLSLWWHKRRDYLFLATPIAAVMAASALKVYPFDGRTIFFLFPQIIILTVFGASVVIRASSFKKYMATVVVIFLSFMPSMVSAKQFMEYLGPEAIKPVLYYLKHQKHSNDVILVYRGSKNAFDYYQKRFRINNPAIVVNHANIDEVIEKIKGSTEDIDGRIWVIFTHVKYDHRMNERTYILEKLNKIAHREDDLVLRVHPAAVVPSLENNISAAVYMYELEGS